MGVAMALPGSSPRVLGEPRRVDEDELGFFPSHTLLRGSHFLGGMNQWL